jgi:hypothetical protein
MKALRKGIFYAAILLVALTVLALISVNLFLRSPGIREKVAQAFEKRLGAEVTYEAISYLPWRGIKVTSLKMNHQEDIALLIKMPFFHADSVRAKISLWSLAERPLQLGKIYVHQPKLRTILHGNGSVALPWSKPLSSPSEILVAKNDLPTLEPKESIERLTATEKPQPNLPEIASSRSPQESPTNQPPPVTAPPTANQPPPAPRPPQKKPPRVLFSDVEVIDGAISLLGPNGNGPLLTIKGVSTRLDLITLFQRKEGAFGKTLGSFNAAIAAVAGALTATEAQGEIRLRNDGALSLARLIAKSDGGTIEGELIADPRRQGFPFQANFKANSIEVAPMVSRVTSRLSFSKGVIEGTFEAEGFLTAPDTWQGRGTGAMTDASLERNGLLESLGRYIGLKEFVELELHEATTEFVIQGPAAYFRDIHWRTDNLEFKGRGAVGLNRQAKLAVRLYFSERVRSVLQRIESQLPDQGIREVQQLEGREDYFRDFLIAGPFAKLRANFIGSEGRTFEETIKLIREASESSPPTSQTN